MQRREWLKAVAAALITGPVRAGPARLALAALERQPGERLGVAVLDTASGRLEGHRLHERFGMCSTFKLPLAALVLREADAGRLALTEFLRYTERDLVPHTPVTELRLPDGAMSVVELAEAAQKTSDNLAANLLVRRLGGPAAVTALLRDVGDPTTKLDRLEPMMTDVRPGDPRDTTTPAAIARTTARFLTGDLLAPASRDRLIGWMVATETGKRRLRAGFPADWRAGDKTGTGYGPGRPDRTNDIAIAWPPGRRPLIVAAFHEAPEATADDDAGKEAVLAAVGRRVAGAA
jgi:beta-lactamase class A